VKIRTILALARKDALDMLQNRGVLVGLLITPLMAVLFAFLNALLTSSPTHLLIYNPGGSAVERVVSGAFTPVVVTHAASADEVVAAFGPNGAHRQSSYALGLVVPANFESDLRAGRHPQLLLFVNGDDVKDEQRLLLQQALIDYGRQVVSPQPPLQLTTGVINPPRPQGFAADSGAFFTMYVLLMTVMSAGSLVPALIIEEKEKKTLRLLISSPASFADIIAGKLVVSTLLQFLLLIMVMLIMHNFGGSLAWLFLFLLVGTLMATAMGLLIGCLLNTMAGAGALSGLLIFLIIVPALFVGPIAQLVQDNPLLMVMKAIPIYYLAEGIYNSLSAHQTIASALLDLAVVGGTALILLIAAGWSLRRQAVVASAI
jgi:ABC-2 type transport system permease protein